MIDVVCVSLIGIFEHGRIGTSRQAGTVWPPNWVLAG